MNNEKRIANYVKQRKATTSACLSFRQKRRIRKHGNKSEELLHQKIFGEEVS
jgi:hypothetical protein